MPSDRRAHSIFNFLFSTQSLRSIGPLYSEYMSFVVHSGTLMMILLYGIRLEREMIMRQNEMSNFKLPTADYNPQKKNESSVVWVGIPGLNEVIVFWYRTTTGTYVSFVRIKISSFFWRKHDANRCDGNTTQSNGVSTTEGHPSAPSWWWCPQGVDITKLDSRYRKATREGRRPIEIL
jgi:hypothetical protein